MAHETTHNAARRLTDRGWSNRSAPFDLSGPARPRAREAWRRGAAGGRGARGRGEARLLPRHRGADPTLSPNAPPAVPRGPASVPACAASVYGAICVRLWRNPRPSMAPSAFVHAPSRVLQACPWSKDVWLHPLRRPQILAHFAKDELLDLVSLAAPPPPSILLLLHVSLLYTRSSLTWSAPAPGLRGAPRRHRRPRPGAGTSGAESPSADLCPTPLPGARAGGNDAGEGAAGAHAARGGAARRDAPRQVAARPRDRAAPSSRSAEGGCGGPCYVGAER